MSFFSTLGMLAAKVSYGTGFVVGKIAKGMSDLDEASRKRVEQLETEQRLRSVNIAETRSKTAQEPLSRSQGKIIPLAGVTWEGRQDIIPHCKQGDPVKFVMRSGGIEVRSKNGMSLGYIPDDHKGEYISRIDNGETLHGRVQAVVGGGVRSGVKMYYGLRIEISWTEFGQLYSYGRSTFNVGEQLVHPSFGQGVVVSISCEYEDQIIEVDFAIHGLKRLKVSIAGMTSLTRPGWCYEQDEYNCAHVHTPKVIYDTSYYSDDDEREYSEEEGDGWDEDDRHDPLDGENVDDLWAEGLEPGSVRFDDCDSEY